MVGVSGDLIDEYLRKLRASLRTPPHRTAQILAEAEDHLRESAAAGEALGLTERDAQEAAIAAFGPVRAVVRAHRRPASAVAAELGLAAWKLAAIYLLAVAGAGIVLLLLFRVIGVHADGPPDPVGAVAGLGGCGIAGLALLAGYLRARRSQRRRGRRAPEALLGGYFPLVTAIFMLPSGPVAVTLTTTLAHPSGAFALPSLAGVVGSIVVALGYAVQMGRTIVRQGRRAGPTDREANYA